jgi:hypothetical protein
LLPTSPVTPDAAPDEIPSTAELFATAEFVDTSTAANGLFALVFSARIATAFPPVAPARIATELIVPFPLEMVT